MNTRKQVHSFSLAKDVRKELKRISRLWGVSQSSVVEQAILYMGAKKENQPANGKEKA